MRISSVIIVAASAAAAVLVGAFTPDTAPDVERAAFARSDVGTGPPPTPAAGNS